MPYKERVKMCQVCCMCIYNLSNQIIHWSDIRCLLISRTFVVNERICSTTVLFCVEEETSFAKAKRNASELNLIARYFTF